MQSRFVSAIAVACLVALCLLAAPTAANAGLIGSTVEVAFYYPTPGNLFCSNGSAVVSAGVEYPSGCGGFWPVAIDIADATLSVDNSLGWSPGAFNGFLLSVPSGPAIVGATYAGGTMGVTSLVVDSAGLWLNFDSQSGGIAYFDVSTNAVPDAGSSLLLLGMGLAGLRAWRKR